MVVFPDPAPPIPAHAFPGLLHRLDRQGGEQHPFQRLHPFGGVEFPHPHHPHVQTGQLVSPLVRGHQAQRPQRQRPPPPPAFARLSAPPPQALLVPPPPPP